MLDGISVACGLLLSAGCASCGKRFVGACEDTRYRRAFWLKGAAGLCFLAMGLLAAEKCANPDFAWRVCLGLFLGLVGDELLALRFIYTDKYNEFFSAGAASFAVGHVLYIRALLLVSGARLTAAIPIALAGAAASAVYARIRRVNAGKLSVCAVAYIALVVFMAATAFVTSARVFSVGALMFAVAGICFAVSDNILCAQSYGNKKTAGMNRAVHVTYYAAQLLIAWSMIFI